MIQLPLAVAAAVFAAIPLVVFLRNVLSFAPLPARATDESKSIQPLPRISVLIPARNEQSSIGPAIRSVLANGDVEFELIVLDDDSSDDTANIVLDLAQTDSRLRLERSEPLPAGWCGKQHACQLLAGMARYELLLWMDADVRLSPDALRRIVGEMQRSSVSLLSGFPHELTGSFLEKLLIPLIHFILLGYCPTWLMQKYRLTSLGAGCGQLFVARKTDYLAAGGHAAIRASLHDGIALPRTFRRAGFLTGIFDATDLATCRMYQSAGATWQGLLKNAGEGLATSRAIVPWTLILLTGQILPFALLLWIWLSQSASPMTIEQSQAIRLCALACVADLLVRLIAAVRFRQSVAIIVLHPLAILLLLIIQWQAVILRLRKRPTAWRGRAYPSVSP